MVADSDNRQSGEGQDSYGNAARQAAKAAEQIGQKASEKTAQKGAEAAFNAAANTVKAGIKTGKAVSEIAAGTAVGGPAGAILSAAWSMRHTIFKVLICVCLAVLFIVVTVVALPGILIENIVNVYTPGSDKPVVLESYYDLSAIVTSSIERGHSYSELQAEKIIADGDYDYELSKASFSDMYTETKDYTICYILAAYSVSEEQNDFSRENLIYRLDSVVDRMFPVTYEIKEETRTVKEGEESEIVTVKYVVCTIRPFDESVINEAFLLDLSAQYGNAGLTYGEIVDYYTQALLNILNIGD